MSGSGTTVSLSWNLAKQKLLFQGNAGCRGGMGWWVGDGPRPSRQSGQSERRAGCTPQCGLEAAALVHGLGRLL